MRSQNSTPQYSNHCPARTTRIAAFVTALAALTATTLVGAPLKIELPAETASYKAGPGMETAMAQCLSCHSPEYVSTQPPLTPAAWKAIIEKMQRKFGAPIPNEQVDVLVDYIVKTYGAAPSVGAPKK